MDNELIGVVSLGFFAYALVSKRLAGTPVTAPMIFIVFGLALASFGVAMDAGHGAVHIVAEFTLILILFTDATRIRIRMLARNPGLPVRMLLFGLPLVIAAGTLAAMGLFPSLSIWEAALLAAVLAPTDAALGQAVVADTAVPVRIRQALNVESGLNDGIALPAVLLLAAVASGMGTGSERDFVVYGIMQITLGPVAGIATGWIAARLLDSAIARGLVANASQGIGILATAILSYTAAEWIGGNGFISAFTAGLVFGATVRHECHYLFEFMESEGELLLLMTFLIFGAAMLPDGLAHVDFRVVAYAILSLTVLRMLPISLSLAGSGVSPATHLFLGWFGPRGLASILFALLIVERASMQAAETILTVTVVTVALSALLHGATAAPLAKRYAAIVHRQGDCAELRSVPEMPLRTGNAKPPQD